MNLFHPITFDRANFNKVPLFAPNTNYGRPCNWVVPIYADATTPPGTLSLMPQLYPFVFDDISRILQNLFYAKQYPVGTDTEIQASTWYEMPTGSIEMGPNNVSTIQPFARQRWYMGCSASWTITNHSSGDVFVKAFKVCARKDLDSGTYVNNILQEYCNALWSDGHGTNNATVDSDTMSAYFNDNEYDLFDSPTFLHSWKVLRATSFKLAPGKSRTFRIKIRPRLWYARDFFNDQEPIVSYWRNQRTKGVPEWVFKYTSVPGSTSTPAPYSGGQPNYTQLTPFMLADVGCEYQIKYECKKFPFPDTEYSFSLGTGGQAAANTANIFVHDIAIDAAAPRVL